MHPPRTRRHDGGTLGHPPRHHHHRQHHPASHRLLPVAVRLPPAPHPLAALRATARPPQRPAPLAEAARPRLRPHRAQPRPRPAALADAARDRVPPYRRTPRAQQHVGGGGGGGGGGEPQGRRGPAAGRAAGAAGERSDGSVAAARLLLAAGAGEGAGARRAAHGALGRRLRAGAGAQARPEERAAAEAAGGAVGAAADERADAAVDGRAVSARCPSPFEEPDVPLCDARCGARGRCAAPQERRGAAVAAPGAPVSADVHAAVAGGDLCRVDRAVQSCCCLLRDHVRVAVHGVGTPGYLFVREVPPAVALGVGRSARVCRAFVALRAVKQNRKSSTDVCAHTYMSLYLDFLQQNEK
eukprot:Rhum_TRINITY_DN124_c0_g1::Rhum_TRINITY_DN124_c0_g1_i1::g.367::m.367